MFSICRRSEFTLRQGPIFTDILLADEINRTPPKTQAALLEAMEERQTTIDGERYPLSPMFTVLATENPIEYEGTYPLPEAQLDRFLLKILIDYPPPDAEREIVARWDAGFNSRHLEQIDISAARATRRRFSTAATEVKQMRMEPGVQKYIVEIVHKTRKSPDDSLRRKPARFGRAAALLKSSRGDSRARFSDARRRARRRLAGSASSSRAARRSRTRRRDDRRGDFRHFQNRRSSALKFV